MPSPSPRELLNAALHYAAMQLEVLPLRQKGKEPLTPHGVKDATADADIINNWWSRWPAANIGLAVPCSILVLDIDSHEALHQLQAEGRVLPATVHAQTARGHHFWYRTPKPVSNRIKLLPNIDVRAAGGYVVVPPSAHPSGSHYRWRVKLQQSAIAEVPSWLLSLLSESDRSEKTARDWQQTVCEPIYPGRRNQTLAEVTGLLFRNLPAYVAAEMAFCWSQIKLQPPLPLQEVLKTINSIAGCELRNQGGHQCNNT